MPASPGAGVLSSHSGEKLRAAYSVRGPRKRGQRRPDQSGRGVIQAIFPSVVARREESAYRHAHCA